MWNLDNLKAFYECFKGRLDAYAVQNDNGTYSKIVEDLTLEDIEAHLKGLRTIGVYLINPKDNTVNFTVIDHDTKDPYLFNRLILACEKVELKDDEILLEDSGNKGRHIFILFNKPIPAKKAKLLGEIIVKLSESETPIEVFPKQERVNPDGFGNLIKLPLGKHKKGDFSYFLNKNLEKADFLIFKEIKRISEEKVDEIIKEFNYLIPNKYYLKNPDKPEITKPQRNITLPCIENALKNGVKEGYRNIAFFNISAYLKSKKIDFNEALNKLNEWDLKNTPPINSEKPDFIKKELERIYSNEYFPSCEQMRSFCDPECPKEKNEENNSKIKYSSFINDPENFIAEILYDPEKESCGFVILNRKDGSISRASTVTKNGIEYSPYNDDQIIGKAILLPSGIEEYGDTESLLQEIEQFIYKSVELDPIYQKVSAQYVLLSYLYDCFNVCPYLRFHGDFSSGKTRALTVIGSICYKTILCSGATTTAPMFRLIDKYNGTLAIDEADFKFSDATNDLVKILNQGYTKGAPVLRCQESSKKQEVVAFDVYGPKLLATRGFWNDKSLESRCITVEMKERRRSDIPLHLDDDFPKETQKLRNKLTLWRLRNFGRKIINESLRNPHVEDRINQIMLPIASILGDNSFREEYFDITQALQKKLLGDRTFGLECNIAEAIIKLWKGEHLYIRDISAETNNQLDEKDKISASAIGKALKNKLGLQSGHSKKGNYAYISQEDIDRFKAKFKLEDSQEPKTVKA